MNTLPDELIVDICNLIDPVRDISVIHRSISANRDLVAVSSTCVRLRRICWHRTFHHIRLSGQKKWDHVLANDNDGYWENTKSVHISLGVDNEGQIVPHLQSLVAFIPRIDRVSTLVLEVEPIRSRLPSSAASEFHILLQILATLHDVRHLSLVFHKLGDRELKWKAFLTYWTVSLETLELRFNNSTSVDADEEHLRRLAYVKRFTLDVPATFRPTSDKWGAAIEFCVAHIPLLEEFHFRTSRGIESIDVADFMVSTLDTMGTLRNNPSQRINVVPLRPLKHLRKLTIGAVADWDLPTPFTDEAAKTQEREWAQILVELVPQLTQIVFGGFLLPPLDADESADVTEEDFEPRPPCGVWRRIYGQELQLDSQAEIGSVFKYPCGFSRYS